MDVRGWFRRRPHQGGDAPAPVARPSRGDWRTLPPLQRLAPATTTIDTGFDQRLATAGTPMFLGELGHLVDPDGPGGTITSLTGASIEQPSADETSEVASARRIDYGGRAAGRVTASPPAPSLSRAPAPPVQRHLAAAEPPPEPPRPVAPVSVAGPADPSIGPPDVDPADTGTPIAGSARPSVSGAEPRSPAASDPSSDSAADSAAEDSAPTIGARPLLGDVPSGRPETSATSVDRAGASDRPVAGPAVQRSVDAASDTTPGVAPVQRWPSASPTTPGGAPVAMPVDPVDVEPERSAVARREVRGERPADVVGTDTTSNASDATTDAIDGTVTANAIDAAEETGGAADDDTVAPIISRSASPVGSRPRIGNPFDAGTRAPRSAEPALQRSQPQRPGPVPTSPGTAPPPTTGEPARRAPRHLGGPSPEVSSDPAGDRPGESAMDSAPVAPDAEAAAPVLVDPAPAPTIQPLLGGDAPVVARSVPTVEDSGDAPARQGTRPAPHPVPSPDVRSGSSQPTVARSSSVPTQRSVTSPSSRTGEPVVTGRITPETRAGRPAPIVQRRTLGLDGWTPRADAHGTPSAEPPVRAPGDDRSGGAGAPDDVVQRATVDIAEHARFAAMPSTAPRPADAAPTMPPSRATVARSVAPAPPPARPPTPSRSTSASLPPSILGAIGHASEITPLGRAALESSTVTWADVPDVQRNEASAAPSVDSAQAVAPTEFHAEAAWLPHDLQRRSDDTAPGPTSVEVDEAGGPAAGDSPLATASEADVIGLMRTMYPHLRRRLTRDLLLDRERAGHRTDIRY